ncbi:MAG TPA: HAD family hydrolase [Sphingomicrobium sp.]|nr:HAD family hydrolase [Sphingomicrobium sp.]
MQIKAVLFDIDGTLVDSNELHISAWDEVFRAAGYQFDRATLHRHIGKGGDNYVPALLPDAGEDEQDRLREAHKQLFTGTYISQVKAFPHARELLARVGESGRKVVLASSASGEELEAHVETIGADGLIDETTSKDDVEASKPCPDVFEAALRSAGVAPDEAVVVGDTPYDIEAARRAGIETVAVRSGGFPDEALSGAVAVYDDVAALLGDFDASPLNR